MRDADKSKHQTDRQAGTSSLHSAEMAVGRAGTFHFRFATETLEMDDSLYGLLGIEPGAPVDWQGFLDRVHSDDRPAVENVLTRALAAPGDYHFEFRLARPASNSQRWFASRGRVVRSEAGEPREYFGVVFEVTEYKRIERALRASTRLAQAADNAKTQFLANVSHELRSPLTAILGYSELLAIDAADPEVSERARKINDNGKYLLAIVNDLLDLSKIDADQLELHYTRFSPLQLLADLLSSLAMRGEERGIVVSVEVEGEVPESILSDPVRLRQVLVNILSNAIRFTDAGSVRVVLSYDDEQQSRICFRVIDTGIGIPREDLQQLFDAFFQADQPDGKRAGGTGLGLTISHRLIQMLGGSIDIESEVDEGTTVTVTIPTGSLENVPMVRSDRPISIVEAPSQAEIDRFRLDDCKILVVDDVDDIRNLLRMFLDAAGADVDTAENGVACLDAVTRADARNDVYDLVIMDIMMNEMDGFEALRRLRENGFDAPVIAITAAILEQDREACLQAGFTEYLPKPIDGGELLEMAARLLDRHSECRDEGAEPLPGHPPLQVMLVEDNPDAAEATAELLGHAGYEVHSARTAHEALATITHVRPVAAIVDLQLPDMGGCELLQRLRKKAAEPEEIVFIAFSGRASPGDREEALAAGFDHFVLKPAPIETLISLFPERQERDRG